MNLSRQELLLNPTQMEKIKNANILLIGVGGVGGAVAHMLVRAGISNLTIMDFDKVSDSNINRQFVAYQSTISKYKVDVLTEQLKDINPNINLTALNQKFDSTNNIDLTGYTMIIDCIDDIKAKQYLISLGFLFSKYLKKASPLSPALLILSVISHSCFLWNIL